MVGGPSSVAVWCMVWRRSPTAQVYCTVYDNRCVGAEQQWLCLCDVWEQRADSRVRNLVLLYTQLSGWVMLPCLSVSPMLQPNMTGMSRACHCLPELFPHFVTVVTRVLSAILSTHRLGQNVTTLNVEIRVNKDEYKEHMSKHHNTTCRNKRRNINNFKLHLSHHRTSWLATKSCKKKISKYNNNTWLLTGDT